VGSTFVAALAAIFTRTYVEALPRFPTTAAGPLVEARPGPFAASEFVGTGVRGLPADNTLSACPSQYDPAGGDASMRVCPVSVPGSTPTLCAGGGISVKNAAVSQLRDSFVVNTTSRGGFPLKPAFDECPGPVLNGTGAQADSCQTVCISAHCRSGGGIPAVNGCRTSFPDENSLNITSCVDTPINNGTTTADLYTFDKAKKTLAPLATGRATHCNAAAVAGTPYTGEADFDTCVVGGNPFFCSSSSGSCSAATGSILYSLNWNYDLTLFPLLSPNTATFDDFNVGNLDNDLSELCHLDKETASCPAGVAKIKNKKCSTEGDDSAGCLIPADKVTITITYSFIGGPTTQGVTSGATFFQKYCETPNPGCAPSVHGVCSTSTNVNFSEWVCPIGMGGLNGGHPCETACSPCCGESGSLPASCTSEAGCNACKTCLQSVQDADIDIDLTLSYTTAAGDVVATSHRVQQRNLLM